MIVAIHQPNYFPWLGYFAKLLASDVFVFLDHVQLSKGSYTPRVQILCQGQPFWLTVPVRTGGRFGQAINEAGFDDRADWRGKHLKTLRLNYGKHPHFKAVFSEVEGLLEPAADSLASLNERLVVGLARRMGAGCQFIRSSDMGLPDLHSSELLAEIVRRTGGDQYLHGSGARKYQDDTAFAREHVTPVAHSFEHPTYPQMGTSDFIPGLSVLDALFNVGFEGVPSLLQRWSSHSPAHMRGTHATGEGAPATTPPSVWQSES